MVIGNIANDFPALDIYAGYQSVIPIVGTTVLNKKDELAEYVWADDIMEEFSVNAFAPDMKEIFKMRPRTDVKENVYDDDFGLSVQVLWL